jgi:hypothetical protein
MKTMKEPLAEWIVANPPREKMIYREAARNQFCFLASTLRPLLFASFNPAECNAHVIGMHTSKSIKLPVVEFWMPGLRIVVRDNFYDWKVSVQSDKPIEIESEDLFNPSEKISSVYCEGFEEWDVFGAYDQNKKRFTVEVYSNDNLIELCTRIRVALDSGFSLPQEDHPKPDSPSE